jgi:quinol monooxygenase YgiN
MDKDINMKDNQVHVRAEFTIIEGKIDEFKKLIQDMSRMVEANEPDTIDYEFYLNSDETKCMVHETYVNSEAALVHNDSIASQTILPKIFSVARLNRFDFYGKPSKELRELITSLNPQIYNLFTGYSR